MDKRCDSCCNSAGLTGSTCKFWSKCQNYSHWSPAATQAETPANPFAYQVGGDHYQNGDLLGPAEWCLRHNLGHAESCAVKYIFRHTEKGGIESLRKAVQYLEFLAYLKYGENL